MKPSLLLIGLGNPGAQYKRTRHNVGYLALDRLSGEFGEGDWDVKQKFLSDVQEARVSVAPALLMKPTTYMNLSGDAVRKAVTYYKLRPASQIIVFVDDIDLPLGDVRFRMTGGPGTHNGMKSIVDSIGKDFPRIRIGIGPKPAKGNLAAWVLSALTAGETKKLGEAFDRLPDMVRKFVMESSEHSENAED
ncbi:aminoacyl-tRNA hydrolase [Candidatus Peregrinibacteria bacterium]|nr:aminoacyl-tRNA hydrolase [Candidatus Peregrinibacteria bacterium]